MEGQAVASNDPLQTDEAAVAIREQVLRAELLRLKLAYKDDVDGLGTKIDALDAQIAALGKLPPVLEERERQIADLKRIVAEREATIHALYASTSWRFARPVRVASRLATAIAQALKRQGPAEASPATEPAVPANAPPPAEPAASPAAPAQDSSGLWSRFSSGPAPGAASRKVLVAVGQWPPPAAAQARLGLFLDSFARSQRSVTLVSLTPPASSATADGTSCAASGLHEIDTLLTAKGGELQYALLIGAGAADALLPLVRLHSPWVRIVVDPGDGALGGAGNADLVLAMTAADKAALLAQAPDAVVEVLPDPIDMPPAGQAGVAGRSQVVYVADPLATDAAALDWLTDVVWPSVRAEMPGAALKIVGAARSAPGIEAVTSTSDLDAILLQARAMVAPAQSTAAAVRSLACGLPLVATPAVAGYVGGQDGVDVLVAAEPDLFAQHIVRLLRDDALWSRIHGNALKLARTRFATETLRKTVDGLFNG